MSFKNDRGQIRVIAVRQFGDPSIASLPYTPVGHAS